MVDDVDIKRFPWTYHRLEYKDELGNVSIMYRVRLDLLIVENPKSLTLFDIQFFSQQDDLMTNYQLAKECGYSCQFGVSYIMVTQSTFPRIYDEIKNHESLCV